VNGLFNFHAGCEQRKNVMFFINVLFDLPSGLFFILFIYFLKHVIEFEQLTQHLLGKG
jgi:hypothetical protein